MRRNTACLFLFGSLLSLSGMAQTKRDSTQAGRNYMIDEVVVTGTRNETDVRHLPMTISVVLVAPVAPLVWRILSTGMFLYKLAT